MWSLSRIETFAAGLTLRGYNRHEARFMHDADLDVWHRIQKNIGIYLTDGEAKALWRYMKKVEA